MTIGALSLTACGGDDDDPVLDPKPNPVNPVNPGGGETVGSLDDYVAPTDKDDYRDVNDWNKRNKWNADQTWSFDASKNVLTIGSTKLYLRREVDF